MDTQAEQRDNPRWVRVMADYSSNGIWAQSGGSAELEYLPVSVALHQRLAAWCVWYEKNDDYLPEEERKANFDYAAFSAEGLAIAKAVKAELPDWTVVYFDEAKFRALMGPPIPPVARSRSDFEYEVSIG
ncbi:hypothetical protein [Burkholderia cenocepacia]|uniref:hypothetical protein n=1 Tax=Burkholderia cenocepacia TaxID=95486 RepID=UPI0007C73DC1|nr:hypothetical protein [Burkholderia cenocepacia]